MNKLSKNMAKKYMRSLRKSGGPTASASKNHEIKISGRENGVDSKAASVIKQNPPGMQQREGRPKRNVRLDLSVTFDEMGEGEPEEEKENHNPNKSLSDLQKDHVEAESSESENIFDELNKNPAVEREKRIAKKA